MRRLARDRGHARVSRWLRLRELQARCLQIGKRGDQVALRLNEFSRLNLEQWCSCLDAIAELGNQLDDSPGMLGKDRHGEILVDRDTAFSHLFGTETDEANRLDLEPRPLLLSGLEGPARRLRRRRLGASARICDRREICR